jgi:hypothetical protein
MAARWMLRAGDMLSSLQLTCSLNLVDKVSLQHCHRRNPGLIWAIPHLVALHYLHTQQKVWWQLLQVDVLVTILFRLSIQSP